MALYKAILLLSVSWPACLIAQDAPADAASEPPAPPPVPPVPPANPPPAPPAVPPVPPPPTPAPPTPAPPTQAPPAPSPPPAPVVTTTADPHTMDKAFFNAARSGNADLAKELLAKKANVDYRDGERKTALCHAASQSHGAVVELLLANRADADAIDERGRSPLFFAAKFGHDEAVFMKILDAAKNLEVSNERGVTPLNIAVRTGKVHAVKALLARGADKHKGDSFGGHAFASAGNSDVDEIRLAFNLSKKTTTMAPVITTQAPRVLGAAKEL